MTDAEARTRWGRQWKHCWACGERFCDVPGKTGETHEICRGAARAQAVRCAAAFLRLCGACHAELFASMPIARQLALKALVDPESYDRQAVCLLRGRDPDEVTEAEVVERQAYWLARWKILGVDPLYF